MGNLVQGWVSGAFTVKGTAEMAQPRAQLSVSVWLSFSECRAVGSPADVNRLIFKK